MTERTLASIERIIAINPIPDAAAIEVATIKGWKVVIRKGEFALNDLVVYLEVDSWVPTELAPFLSKGKEPREYNGVKGERLRTVKLRGQISQGLLLPANVAGICVLGLEEGMDVSTLLGVQKYEPQIPACLAGLAKGNFPSYIPKTNQERVQNLTEYWSVLQKITYEVTEKLDGSSCTVYFNNSDVGVCSHNLDLKQDENNTFWKIAIRENLPEKLTKYCSNIAIQGELVGEGIQGNKYKLKGHALFVFDIYDIDEGRYFSSSERQVLCNKFGLKHVPIIAINYYLPTLIEEMIKEADGISLIGMAPSREGLVMKSMDGKTSFKAISNKFLLSEK